MSRQTDRIALVTGGGRGPGRAIAPGFAEAGADVAVASPTREQLDEVAAAVCATSRRALAVQVDVSDSAPVAQMIDTTCKEFGRIDILVNCAGVGWAERLDQMSDEPWKLTADTNLTGTVYSCREALHGMIEQKSGSIINLASVAGIKGPPGQGAYAASQRRRVVCYRRGLRH